MSSKPSKKTTKDEDKGSKRKSLFDHIDAIRKVQDPNYYKNLSEDDRKSFTHYMIIRALAMDDSMVEDMAQLYQIFDKIPSPQFYQLLIALVPKSNHFSRWIKSKVMKHNKELVSLVAKRFQVCKHHANEYINLLLRTEEGQGELVNICKAFGIEDKEVENLFEEKKSE